MLNRICFSCFILIMISLISSCTAQQTVGQTTQAPLMSISEKKISIPSPIKKIELPQKKYSKKQKLQKLIKSAQKQLNKKHFDRALDLAQQAFEYIQSNFPIKSKERVNSHLLLADIYFTQKKYSAAEIHYQQAFRINKEMLGERHEKSLNVLNQLAQLYHQWKNIQKAEEYYKKLNVIYQDIFGNNHRETLGIIKKLTELLMDSKQYDKARPYAAQALKISKRLYGNNAASTLDAMIQAGKIYYYCKAYVRAFNTFDQALSITQHDMNIPSLKKLDIYQFIGELHELQKRYQDAEDMFKKAIALTQQINGPENSHQLEIYQKLIQLYKHQDKYQEAKTSLIKTVQLSETLLGDKNSQTIRYQKDLANLMFKQKEYGHAAEILSKALESSKYVYGENHEKTFSLSRRLAEIFIAQARYQEAESLYRTNLKVQKKILNATRDNLEQLALLFKMQKNCAGAVELLDQAFRLNEATLGPTHAETLKSLMELIGCMVKSNQHIQALDKLKRIEKPLFKQQLELMQSHQYHENLQGKTHKKSVKLDSSTFCDAVLSLSRSMSDQDVIAYAADVMLRWQYLNHFPEPEQQSLPGHKDINALFKIQMQNLPYRLPRNSAFFHIVPYEHIDFFNTKTTDTRWFVMMILSEQETNHMICQDLGPIHHTRKLIRRLMNHKTEQSQKKQIEFKLFQQLFGIFEENIKNIQSIYISANGYANHIPYDRLRHDDHHFWIERQHICRVFSAMDFLNPISHVYTGSLLAIGQVDYDTFVDIKTGNVNEQTNHFTGANSHIPFPKNQNVNFRYKPHPEESHVIKEIINIYDLCRKSSPVFWSGTEANEFALKRLANPPRVIHFFVDCFYLNLNNDSALNEMSGGLALAGANKGFMKQTDPYGQDGLLLNPEILDLNLNETELVFLTKKCDGYTSESSFSPFFQMAAAFHMAGCRFVISPAWPVRHDTSSMFMIHFYENWLRQSISNPSKALRQTKLQYIAKKVPPKIWDSYVLMGF